MSIRSATRLCVLAHALLLAGLAGATVPSMLSYQGILADGTGQPLEGTHTLVFTVYRDSLSTTPIVWTETHANVTLHQGLFNVILGRTTPITSTVFSTPRWLAIRVDSDPEMAPRLRLTSSAYALRAAIADSAVHAAGAGASDGDWTISGENMYAAVAGSVGIGTSAPGRKLQVGSNTVADSEGMIRLGSRSGTQGSNRLWDIGVPETDGDSSLHGYSFVVDDTQAGTEPEFMVKFGTGFVGIGVVPPDAPLHVHKTTATTADATLHVETHYGTAPLTGIGHLRLTRTSINSEVEGFGTDALFLNSSSDDDVVLATGGGSVGVGTSNPQARLDVNGTARVQVLQITGGADLAERFPASGRVEPGMVVAIDPDRPGRLRLAAGAYDRRVAGVVSGANGLDAGAVLGASPGGGGDDLPLALGGRVWVWCDDAHGPIAPGDLLTTSSTPGHAARVADHARAQGAVIGKAMTPLASGRGLVLVLVSLQ